MSVDEVVFGPKGIAHSPTPIPKGHHREAAGPQGIGGAGFVRAVGAQERDTYRNECSQPWGLRSEVSLFYNLIV